MAGAAVVARCGIAAPWWKERFAKNWGGFSMIQVIPA